MDPLPPRKTFHPKKQARNRHSSAGITDREATRLKKAAQMMYKLSQKRSLYIGYEKRLLTINELIYELLQHADRD